MQLSNASGVSKFSLVRSRSHALKDSSLSLEASRKGICHDNFAQCSVPAPGHHGLRDNVLHDPGMPVPAVWVTSLKLILVGAYIFFITESVCLFRKVFWVRVWLQFALRQCVLCASDENDYICAWAFQFLLFCEFDSCHLLAQMLLWLVCLFCTICHIPAVWEGFLSESDFN